MYRTLSFALVGTVLTAAPASAVLGQPPVTVSGPLPAGAHVADYRYPRCTRPTSRVHRWWHRQNLRLVLLRRTS